METSELWEVLEPLIPIRVNTHRFGGRRSRVPDRTCANGMFYVLRTGRQWKALDATGICSGSTAHLRFQEWVAACLRTHHPQSRRVIRIGSNPHSLPLYSLTPIPGTVWLP